MADLNTYEYIILIFGIIALSMVVAWAGRVWGRRAGVFWVIMLGILGLSSFIDSMVSRTEDEYSRATYGLVIAVICAVFIRDELDTLRKERRGNTRKRKPTGILLKDYEVSGIHLRATQHPKTGDITITGTDELDNEVSCTVPANSDVNRIGDTITDLLLHIAFERRSKE